MEMAPPTETDETSAKKRLDDILYKNDILEFKKILAEDKNLVTRVDEHGMDVLRGAAFRGNAEMCQLLIDSGANVNCDKHDQQYSALHFAGLSGNVDTCQLLLEAGAKIDVKNSAGRTPSQMAGFVANYDCSALMNNFIPKADIQYYTVPRGLETEPKLPSNYLIPLHKVLCKVNIYPVRVALNVQPLLDEGSKIIKVLDLMCEREIKKGVDSNETLAFKLHYIGFIMKQILKISEKDKETEPVKCFIKKLLRGTKEEDYTDLLLKETILQFPDKNCFIFKQMVNILTNQNDVEAFNLINGLINGRRGFTDNVTGQCVTCYESGAIKKCSECRDVHYCDRECQRLHWFIHKKVCNKSKEESSMKKENVKINDDY